MASRSTRSYGIWRRTRGLRRLGALALLAGVVLLLGVASLGFPERWVIWLSDTLSTEDHLVDIEDVTFSLRQGVRVGRLRMRSSGAAEDAWLLLEHAGVRFRWVPGMPSLDWVREVDVRRAVLPRLPARRPGESPAVLPVFGPVHVRCEQAVVLGTPLRNLMAVLTSTGARLEAERIRCDLSPPRHPTEAVSGEFTFGIAERSLRGAINGEVNPARLVPLLRSVGLMDVPDVIERFDFPADPVALRLRLEYAPAQAVRRVEAVLGAGTCFYRGVPFLSAQGTLTAEGREFWSTLQVDQLTVERPEGSARGSLLFDLQRHDLEFSASSTLEPRALCQVLGLFSGADWDAWKFGFPTEVTASGRYAAQPSAPPTAIEGKIRSPSAQWKGFRARGAELEFTVQPDSFRIARAAGRAYGGALEARAEFVWAARSPTRCVVWADLQRARFGALAAAVFDGRAAEDPGFLDLRADLSGTLDETLLHSLRGEGRVRIREAPLYRVPLFAGLTDFMARNVPGVDFVLRQNDLDADFTVGDYRMIFTKLRIEGSLFSITGEGDYWFSDHLDIGVRVNLLKQHTWLGRVLKVALFPVSKLFELELTGPVSAPQWAPTTLALRGRRAVTDEQRGVAPESPPPSSPTEGAP